MAELQHVLSNWDIVSEREESNVELGSRENPCTYHEKPARYERASLTIGVPEVVRIIESLSTWYASDLFDTAKQNLGPVRDEIVRMVELREDDPVGYAQRCLIFAITSPGCKFEDNVELVSRTMVRIEQGWYPESRDSLYKKVFAGLSGRSHGRGCANLYDSWDYIRSIGRSIGNEPIDMSKDTLMSLRSHRTIMGIGQKTASMAAALWDAEAPVFTLDVHMLRGFATIAGFDPSGTYTITDKAYTMLELFLAEKSLRYGSPFEIQWTLWNMFGFGYHVTHLPIFE